MSTFENLKKISLIFFIITGFLHLGANGLIANNLFIKQSFIVSKVMDIPFILTGLIYGFSSLRISLSDPQKSHKVLDISMISIIILTLVGLLIINLFIPNIQS